jgi:hypothetical protein
MPAVITKAKVLTKIRRVLETCLAGIRVEHKEALRRATPGSGSELLESAFLIQERAIKANLAETHKLALLSPRHKICHGSLARLRIMETKRQSRQWWLIAARLSQFISSITLEGEKVLIHDGQLGSESLIGKSAGDHIETPFWHGDGRDKIERIEVLSVY